MLAIQLSYAVQSKKKKRTADGNREERDCKCEKNCSVGRGIGFAAAVQKHLEEKQKRTAEGEMVERTAINQKKCQSPPYRKVRNAQQLQCTSAFSVIVPSPASSFPFDIYIYICIYVYLPPNDAVLSNSQADR